MASIYTRCLVDANVDHVHQGLGARTILQQPLEVTSSHSLVRAVAAAPEVDTEGWERCVAAADETDSVAPVLELQGSVRQVPEAGWIAAAHRSADAGIPLSALYCSMVAAVAAAVELEGLLADCAADLGRQPLAAAALLVSDFH